jgi:hypothetical protein
VELITDVTLWHTRVSHHLIALNRELRSECCGGTIQRGGATPPTTKRVMRTRIYSPECVEGFSEVRQERFKDNPFREQNG